MSIGDGNRFPSSGPSACLLNSCNKKKKKKKKTERNLMNRVLICDSLLRRNETEPFLKKLITGDEKWITYDKNVRKRSWSKAGQASQTVAKPGLTRNKVMLCVWWDWEGIIHYELLPPGRTIDSELYCVQLKRLKQKV
ncbi:hypothetical protein K1T71_011603 [Dendrolimus kikuchii]|uniref:Uncharacterized protein n=1 Tax=Dendrolimus kikuchii TaxID=765133 RepID=A0ACC1CM01_9NEOP|nr:hypothetical protein K1T71_011603 [Dendrolimus kikuchii]